jgi:hypothetical protein
MSWEARRLESSPSLHRRVTGSGTEDDIFSTVGGLEIDHEHRNSSYGHGELTGPASMPMLATLAVIPLFLTISIA